MLILAKPEQLNNLNNVEMSYEGKSTVVGEGQCACLFSFIYLFFKVTFPSLCRRTGRWFLLPPSVCSGTPVWLSGKRLRSDLFHSSTLFFFLTLQCDFEANSF